MPRRGGKAANRRTRQRKAQRQPARPAPGAAPRPTATPVPPVGTPAAREATSLDPPRRSAPPPSAVALRSSLGESARAEYHYVGRDLRNIAVLSAVMFLLLLVAWAAANALNLTGATA